MFSQLLRHFLGTSCQFLTNNHFNAFSERHRGYTMSFLHRCNLKWSYKLNVNSFTKTLLILLFPKKKSSEIFIPIFCMRWRVPLNAIFPVVMNCYISERKMLWSTRNKLLICWYHLTISGLYMDHKLRINPDPRTLIFFLQIL